MQHRVRLEAKQHTALSGAQGGEGAQWEEGYKYSRQVCTNLHDMAKHEKAQYLCGLLPETILSCTIVMHTYCTQRGHSKRTYLVAYPCINPSLELAFFLASNSRGQHLLHPCPSGQMRPSPAAMALPPG